MRRLVLKIIGFDGTWRGDSERARPLHPSSPPTDAESDYFAYIYPVSLNLR